MIKEAVLNDNAEDMKSMVAPIYDNSKVAKWIYAVSGKEMEDAQIWLEELRLQFSPYTATWGLIYHEITYGLEVDLTLSLEQRRIRLWTYLAFRAPMNPERIRQLAQNITGLHAEIIEKVPFQMQIVFQEKDENISIDKKYLKQAIREVRPAHVGFSVLYEWRKYFEIKIPLALQATMRNRFALPWEMKSRECIVNRFQITAELSIDFRLKTIKGTAKFDGTYKFDGSIKFGYSEEVNL